MDSRQDCYENQGQWGPRALARQDVTAERTQLWSRPAQGLSQSKRCLSTAVWPQESSLTFGDSISSSVRWEDNPSFALSCWTVGSGRHITNSSFHPYRGFPGGARVTRHLPMQEPQTGSLSREDPQQEERATHSSIFLPKSPIDGGAGRLQSERLQRVGQQAQSVHRYYPWP